MSSSGFGMVLLVVAVIALLPKGGRQARAHGRKADDPALISWYSAVHEAGHAVVGEAQGATVLSITIREDTSGVTLMEWPWDDGDPRTEVGNVVAGMAGDIAERKAGGVGRRCGHSSWRLRRDLRGTGVRYGQAKREARRLVHRHWRDIERTATEAAR